MVARTCRKCGAEFSARRCATCHRASERKRLAEPDKAAAAKAKHAEWRTREHEPRACRRCGSMFTTTKCKECARLYAAAKRSADPESARRKAREWAASHPEYQKSPAAVAWRMSNADRLKEYGRTKAAERYKADPEGARERKRTWARANPGLVRATSRRTRMKREYGLTPADYASMLAAQGGACAICRRTPADGKVLCVDHHHDSGKVRALLCVPCNTRVGAFEHPLASATRAYIDAHEAASDESRAA